MDCSSNSENPVRYKKHPLQISVILEKVFEYDQSAKSVQRNHMVCKSWHEANYNRWLELPMFLVLCYHPQNVSKVSTSKPIMDLAECYAQFKAGHPKITRMLTTPPYGMELHGWELVSGDLSLHDLDSWFFSLTLTGFLTKLTLTKCSFAQPLWIYQKHFLEKLPNLQTLAIKNGVVHNVHKMGLTETDAQSLLSANSNLSLRNLDISLTFTSPLETFPDLRFYLWLLQLPRLNNLKITLSEYPQELAEKLIRALTNREYGKRLVHFDLLDFSKKAHEIGSDISFDTNFKKLKFVAMDLGFMPERHCQEIEIDLRKLVLYRAPFHQLFPRKLTCMEVYDLELWGNVASNMNLQFLKSPFYLKKLVWNTRCYDNQHKGKRIQHLLNDKQKSYPLFTLDLVGRAIKLPDFVCMYHLDIDFGPLSEDSWARLGQHAKGLQTLKGVFGKDQDLLLVLQIWPKLMVLELKHRSRVSLNTLKEFLPNMENLWKFCWMGCACTSSYFTDVIALKEMESLAHACLKNVMLPWSWAGDTLVQEEFCLEAHFENKLLAASKVCEPQL